jgi:H+/Cl- antiporter ClcA
LRNWLEIRKRRIYKSIEENLYTYVFVTLGSSIIGAVAILFSWLRNHLINILTKPIIRWGTVEVLFALCYIIIVCSFIFLLGKRTKKPLYKPETQSEKQVVP